MALKAKIKEKQEFGIGDTIKVTQKVKEGDKIRKQIFEGIVISIRGREENKSFTVRRIGVGQIGIERIFPLSPLVIDNVEVVRKGTRGVRRAKLYYLRKKHKKEIESIYTRTKKKQDKSNKKSKKTSKK